MPPTWFDVVLQPDTEVVIERELVTTQHLRPGEAVLEHASLAASLHVLAQRPARPDRPVETDRREERAEEQLRVGMAADVDERHPRLRLLARLADRVVVQQIRQSHLRVADVATERQVRRDVDALRRLRPPAAGRPVARPVGHVVDVVGDVFTGGGYGSEAHAKRGDGEASDRHGVLCSR